MNSTTATPDSGQGSTRILFFADAGPAVGGGHVMRGLTLAQALMARGADCGFVATEAAAVVLDAFAGAGIERVSVSGDSAEAIIGAAQRWQADVVVVDHYGLERGHEARLRAAGSPLVVMDDLRRRHDCDLVLDSNLGRTADDYPGVASLTGPGFALVRPEFAQRREAALARRALGEPPRRLLVSLGLTDVGGVTARVVEVLVSKLGDLSLDVVLGDSAPSLERLRALSSNNGRVRLHINTHDMPALTAGADLAVGAGGSSTWERCCLGLPTITVVLADNQRPNAIALEAEGATLVVEASAQDLDDKLAALLARLIAEPARQAMSRAAARLCDGAGADRVAERVLALAPPRQ
jgi:UDP-2,4-diacetamido-2,4,6-trideoxy-beta-L-altropyranose hydrolase